MSWVFTENGLKFDSEKVGEVNILASHCLLVCVTKLMMQVLELPMELLLPNLFQFYLALLGDESECQCAKFGRT